MGSSSSEVLKKRKLLQTKVEDFTIHWVDSSPSSSCSLKRKQKAFFLVFKRWGGLFGYSKRGKKLNAKEEKTRTMASEA